MNPSGNPSDSVHSAVAGDCIQLRDLQVECILGVHPTERQRPRPVLFNLALECDIRQAATGDRLENTLNYERIEEEVRSAAIKGRYRLIETLAEAVAEICLAHPQVKRVHVAVDKPGALPHTRSVAVEIVRTRK